LRDVRVPKTDTRQAFCALIESIHTRFPVLRVKHSIPDNNAKIVPSRAGGKLFYFCGRAAGAGAPFDSNAPLFEPHMTARRTAFAPCACEADKSARASFGKKIWGNYRNPLTSMNHYGRMIE
jgi:hypothetical protein